MGAPGVEEGENEEGEEVGEASLGNAAHEKELGFYLKCKEAITGVCMRLENKQESSGFCREVGLERGREGKQRLGHLPR